MRVVVAMSGGVDSSTVAGLLREAGNEVIGVTLQLYDHGAASGRRGACCAGQDIHDARRVADHLGIPHYVIDAEARFQDAVIGDFAASYAAGETPVPCVRCNQHLKFTDLLRLAGDLKADMLATGHYARRVEGPDGPELHRASDLTRDQSWFLFATTQAQLAFLCFPLGALQSKLVVRAEAARLGLPVSDKPDSQDICFVVSGNYAETVTTLRPDAGEPGEIVALDGRVVGSHAGIAGYTVGQRKRLGAAARVDGQDQVVVALDARRRRVIVGPHGTGCRRVLVREVNWLIAPPEVALSCQVKLRAREAQQSALVRATPDGAEVLLDRPGLPAPGQACVFYDGNRVLGGGFIHRSELVDLEELAAISPASLGSHGGVAQR